VRIKDLEEEIASTSIIFQRRIIKKMWKGFITAITEKNKRSNTIQTPTLKVLK